MVVDGSHSFRLQLFTLMVNDDFGRSSQKHLFINIETSCYEKHSLFDVWDPPINK